MRRFGANRPKQVAAERIRRQLRWLRYFASPDCAVECSALTCVGKMLRCVATWCPVSRDMLNAKLADRGARRPPKQRDCIGRCTLHAARCMSHVRRMLYGSFAPSTGGGTSRKVPVGSECPRELLRVSLLRHLSGLPSCDTCQDFHARRASKPLPSCTVSNDGLSRAQQTQARALEHMHARARARVPAPAPTPWPTPSSTSLQARRARPG